MTGLRVTYRLHLEEGVSGAAVQCAVLDLGLLGEVVSVLDRRQHTLDGEERRQVGRIRRDDDEREEPPDAADDAPRHRPVTGQSTQHFDVGQRHILN